MQFKFMYIVFAVMIDDVHCKRLRRVVNGEQFNGRPTTYSVIRYYAAMASAHQTPFFTGGEKWSWLSWLYNYGNMICSGALLTPSIYQTACHCLTRFSTDNKHIFRPPLRNSHWEGRAVIYPGVSHRFGEESFVTYDPILTGKFLIHHRCAGIGGDGTLTFDYGLIILNAEWFSRKSPYPWAQIRWAPTYTEKSMKDFHRYALNMRLVCMIIGFGYTQRYTKSVSDHLLHGWGALLSESECLKDPRIAQLYKEAKLTPKDVFKYFNWVCTQNFTMHDQESGPGDSGSPFTCDNKHYGVLSGRRFELDGKGLRVNIVTKHHLLVRTAYSNAVDYRQFFIRNILYDPDYSILYVRSLHQYDHPLKHKGVNWVQTGSPAIASFGSHDTPPLLSWVLVAVLKSLID